MSEERAKEKPYVQLTMRDYKGMITRVVEGEGGMNNTIIYIGIDPGLNGALAAITDAFSINIFKMPTVTHGNGRKAPDHVALKEFFRGFQSLHTYAILELQHAMPKQGVVSTLNTGYGFGALKQCLVDFAIPHEVVQASTWQKEFRISARKGNANDRIIRYLRS